MSERNTIGEAVIDPALVAVQITEIPIKTSGAEIVGGDLLKGQAAAAVGALKPVDYYSTRGTCIDERFRAGFMNGTAGSEVRASVLGGPNVYALAVAELIGYFGDTPGAATAHLGTVTQKLHDAKLRSGGHAGCAANAGLGGWITTIAEQPEGPLAYAALQRGADYDDKAAKEVVSHAKAVVASGRYATWTEAILVDALGDESGEAIESLGDVPHAGLTVIRNKIDGYTIDQTALYESSVLGKGSFDFDDSYAELIENALTAGPDAAWKKVVAAHAREMAIAAVAGAVPNEELYQIDLSLR